MVVEWYGVRKVSWCQVSAWITLIQTPDRDFPMRIPTLMLCTATTAACSDPLIGEWELEDYDECKEYVYEGIGTIYKCMDVDWKFEIDDEYNGEFAIISISTYEGIYIDGTVAFSEQGNYADSGTVTAKESENGYQIVFEEETLECTLSSGYFGKEKNLQCSTEDFDQFPTQKFSFKPKPD